MSSTGSKRYSKRRKARSVLRNAKNFALKHTCVLPLVLLVIFLSLYALNPTESNPIHRFIFLSYELPPKAPGEPAQYGKGLWDIAFVSFYTIVLSFTREFIMQELLRPLARYAGLKSRGKQARFMEQMYTAIYFSVLGPAGMYVMSRTPVWYFNTRGMYEDFPHRTHEGVFKFYYLFQAAYWAQQAIVLVIGMEKPRKDYNELVCHHIVSLALIGLSYRFHFTYMGLAVYVTHDISDFFLAVRCHPSSSLPPSLPTSLPEPPLPQGVPVHARAVKKLTRELCIQTSKSLNYIDHWLTPPYFAFFMGVWIYMRHYLNLKIILSLLTEFPYVGPYELNWETEQYKCLLSNVITFGLLAALQALNLFWLFFIVRIAYRLVVHNITEDDRSEAEESELETEEPSTPALPNGKPAEEATPLLTNGKAKAAANGSANGAAKKTVR